MARYSPHTNYFNYYTKFSVFYKYLFFTALIVSTMLTFIDLAQWSNVLSIFALILLQVLELVTENYKSKAETTRRLDFIDNSLGSMFIHDPSEEYFDNEEIEYGFEKMYYNLMENSYFSFSLTTIMIEKSIYVNLIFIITIISFSIYGFSNSQFALPILQLYLSKYFVLDLINTRKFNSVVEDTFNDLKELEPPKQNVGKVVLEKELVKLIKLLITYETAISETNIKVSSKLFITENERLTREWLSIKERYRKEVENEC